MIGMGVGSCVLRRRCYANHDEEYLYWGREVLGCIEVLVGVFSGARCVNESRGNSAWESIG